MKPGSSFLAARRLATAAAVLVGSTLLAACGGGGEPGPGAPDPRGSDATFNFSWRINGQTPGSDNDVCRAAGIRFIRMTVVDDRNVDHHYDAFRFDCHLGSYRSAQPELRAGSYRIYWEAISAEGNRVSLAAGNFDREGVLRPTYEALNVVRGRHVDFDATNKVDEVGNPPPSVHPTHRVEASFPGQPTNFATGTGPLEVRILWAQTPGATSGVDCATAGVAALNWTLRMSNGVPVEAHATQERCTPEYAVLRWDALNFDRYMLNVSGFDAMGAEGWRVRCENLLAATADGTGSRHDCVVDRLPAR